MSTSNDSPTPSSLPQVGSSPIFNYNPYASDRSISIPPPTPPPIIPQQTVDPMNRANSLPPGANQAVPSRNAAVHHQPKNTPGRPGLPPPHPVHQLLQSQTQNEMPPNKTATLPSPNNYTSQQFPAEDPRLPAANQDLPRQLFNHGSQDPHVIQAAQSMSPMQEGPSHPSLQGSSSNAPMKGAPPPPPPPPPPPGGLGIVAKHGVTGVPLPGNKQVKSTISLAEIRAGNSYLEPDRVQEVPPVNSPIMEAAAPVFQQQPVYSNNTMPANEAQCLQNIPLSGNVILQSELDKTRENGFVESLHEFEAQRNAMMSPPATSRNINNFQDSRIDSSVNSVNAQDGAFNQSKPTYNTLPLDFNSFSTEPVSQLPLSVLELNNQTLNRKNPPVPEEEINTNVHKPTQSNATEHSAKYSDPTNIYQQNENMYGSAESSNQQFFTNPETTYQPLMSENKSEPSSPKKPENGPQPKLNDDIKMSRPRERSIPRQQSLQRDCEGHNVTPNAYKQDMPDSKQRYPLSAQKSIDKDEPELMEINGTSGRRDSDASTQGYVRYRPETPRVVTPVKFSATPKLPNRGLQKQTSLQDKPQNVPLPPKPIEKAKPNNVFDDVKKIVRNVSDSGISVNSSTPEPEETAAKIVTESMQKIEAQMKNILGSKNIETAKKIENSESTSSVNSLNQVNNESKRGSIVDNGQDIQPSSYSGYSTCSEEELKFEEPKISTPIKTAPFEVMEDFEEAPEEFDLGISSYSISHPVETEEMEKTPVPEVIDNNETAKASYEETPYRVSPPSKTSTLEFKKKSLNDRSNQQYSQAQNPNYHQQQFPEHQYQQQTRQQQPMPNTTPFMNPQDNMFNQMQMPMGFSNMSNMNLPNMPNMGLQNMMGKFFIMFLE